MKLTFILICAMILCGCTTTAENWKLKDGIMVLEQQLKLQGLGNREVQFEDKSKLKTDTGFRVPDIKIDTDELFGD